MIIFKPGAEPHSLRPEIYSIFPILDGVFGTYNVNCIITCTDGDHGPDDPHPNGFAVDCRTWHIPGLDDVSGRMLAVMIQRTLGKLYYVQYEPIVYMPNGKDIKNGPHIHIQIKKAIWPTLK